MQGHVIVAGGAIGLGAAVTSRLTEVGASVTVIDQERSPDGLPTEIVDLADGLATEAAVLRLVEAGDDPSAVVTCADVDIPGRLDEIAGDEWEKVVAVNLIGTAAVIRAALPSLRRTQGRIVTVASPSGIVAWPRQPRTARASSESWASPERWRPSWRARLR